VFSLFSSGKGIAQNPGFPHRSPNSGPYISNKHPLPVSCPDFLYEIPIKGVARREEDGAKI